MDNLLYGNVYAPSSSMARAQIKACACDADIYCAPRGIARLNSMACLLRVDVHLLMLYKAEPPRVNVHRLML